MGLTGLRQTPELQVFKSSRMDLQASLMPNGQINLLERARSWSLL